MRLTRFAVPLRGRTTFGALGIVAMALAAVLVPPALVCAGTGAVENALVAGAAAVLLFATGALARRSYEGELETREGLVVTALVYPLFSIAGAAIFLPQTSYLNGVFESMSALTTTGLSVTDPGSLPPGLLFFRAWSQWIGGIGIVVVGVVLFQQLGRSAARLQSTESGRENLVGSMAGTARIVVFIYGGMTVAAFLALWLSGLEPFQAFLVALATVSTGGFSPRPDSLAGTGLWTPLTVMLFSVAGALNFPLLYTIRTKGARTLFGDPEFRYGLGLTLAATLGFLGIARWFPAAVLPSVFHAVSASTTTGFSMTDPSGWPDSQKLLAILLMTIGGSSGSTAGGFKLIRFIALVKIVNRILFRDLLPSRAVTPLRITGQRVTEERLVRLLAFVGSYMFLLLAGAVLLTLSGFTVSDSLFESASALGTCGLSSGVTSPHLVPWARLFLIIQMWAGRLEIIPVLILFHPATWVRAGGAVH